MKPLTPKQKAIVSAGQRAYYEACQSAGVCVRCKVRQIETGSATYCKRCLEYAAEANRKYHERKVKMRENSMREKLKKHGLVDTQPGRDHVDLMTGKTPPGGARR